MSTEDEEHGDRAPDVRSAVIAALGEVQGKDIGEVERELSANSVGDLEIPSPQAMAVLGILSAQYDVDFKPEDVLGTKCGAYCSVTRLTELVQKKVNEEEG